MSGALLALALYGATPDSLGIGMDVLPEAFAYAAGWVSYVPRMRLARCSGEGCEWSLGDGVAISATFADGSLSVDHIEASLAGPVTEAGRTHYRKACLTIVALLEAAVEADQQRAIGDSILRPATDGAPIVQLADETGRRFFGTPDRCGVSTRDHRPEP